MSITSDVTSRGSAGDGECKSENASASLRQDPSRNLGLW